VRALAMLRLSVRHTLSPSTLFLSLAFSLSLFSAPLQIRSSGIISTLQSVNTALVHGADPFGRGPRRE
jgi:hypothetical protein